MGSLRFLAAQEEGLPSHTHPHQIPVGMRVVLSPPPPQLAGRELAGDRGSLSFLPLKSKALSSEHSDPLSEKQFEVTKGRALIKTTG